MKASAHPQNFLNHAIPASVFVAAAASGNVPASNTNMAERIRSRTIWMSDATIAVAPANSAIRIGSFCVAPPSITRFCIAPSKDDFGGNALVTRCFENSSDHIVSSCSTADPAADTAMNNMVAFSNSRSGSARCSQAIRRPATKAASPKTVPATQMTCSCRNATGPLAVQS
jgi:hypothetical protein